nr:MAG TPA: hypothetical protein [Caudoviricetes sp.]
MEKFKIFRSDRLEQADSNVGLFSFSPRLY